VSAAPGPAAARVRVVTTDPTPPFEQVRRQLAELMATGVLRPGSRLPPVRQLAGDLGLAVGTVARAYRELEAAELVVTRRGGGTRVAERPGNASRERTAAVQRLARDYVRAARLLGATDDELVRALADATGRGRAGAAPR
jgi:DNA-binding transcriptional regulator YhcF (GntR family)